MFIKRIVNAQVMVEFNKFRVGLFYQFLFSWSGQVCNGLGYDLEEISVNVTYGYVILTCYTGIVTDLFDWDSVWKGEWNKYSAECAYLDPWASASIGSTKILSALNNQVLLGGITTNKAGCIKFGQYASWAPYFTGLAYKALRHYELGGSDI